MYSHNKFALSCIGNVQFVECSQGDSKTAYMGKITLIQLPGSDTMNNWLDVLYVASDIPNDILLISRHVVDIKSLQCHELRLGFMFLSDSEKITKCDILENYTYAFKIAIY